MAVNLILEEFIIFNLGYNRNYKLLILRHKNKQFLKFYTLEIACVIAS